MTAPPVTPLRARLQGYFVSLLSWEQLTSFWDILLARADAGWYVYAVGEEVPVAPRTAEQIIRFVHEVDILLHRDHDEDLYRQPHRTNAHQDLRSQQPGKFVRFQQKPATTPMDPQSAGARGSGLSRNGPGRQTTLVECAVGTDVKY